MQKSLHNVRQMTITEAIGHAVVRRNLQETDARAVMDLIMDGEATPAQIAALLVALRMKGETGPEITGFAKAMRSRVTPIRSSRTDVIDTCGTGGDSLKTFNLSTASAIVASAAGVPVAKHGNRAVSSKCGSADILEALGVNLMLSPEGATRLLDEIGITFLFAPNYHPAMKHAAAPRREIGLRSIFNLVGPLTNPAGADRQLIGVYAPTLVPKMAKALRSLGCKRGVVAHGLLGLDEVAPIGATRLAIIEEKEIIDRVMQAEEFGIVPPSISEIACGADIGESRAKIGRALEDAQSPEARAVLPSAGVAIWVGGRADSIHEGVVAAREAIASGKAAAKLKALIEMSNQFGAVPA